MKIRFKIIIGLLGYLIIGLFCQKTKAATLLQSSDLLSTVNPGAKATHTITFTPPTGISTGGKIIIAFPAIAPTETSNPASASGSTFQLNALSDSVVSISGLTGGTSFTGSYGNPTTTSPSPTITLTLTGTSAITAYTKITVILGTTPTIINPSKSAPSGTADPWVVRVKTQNSSGNDIDSVRLRVGTFEGVNVQAVVEQTFSMIIYGVQNGIQIQNNNSKCVNNTDITNTGSDSTSTAVGLGNIPINNINISAQDILITTNDKNGYVLTATTSSHLRNSQSGFSFKDSPSPTKITAGSNFFGIHPCGPDSQGTTWGQGTTGAGLNKYAWPAQLTPLSLASHPVGQTASKTLVEYAATADEGVPTGTYNSNIYYLATPTF